MRPVKKYEFYEKIFNNTSIQYGLVAGFFYLDQRDLLYCKEEGFEKVYMTTERQLDYYSDTFEEWRQYIHVPSEMFGPNLMEVWKFFKRKNK